MTPHLIVSLLNFSLGIHECKEIQDKELLAFFQELDPEERYFHIEFPGEYNKSIYPVIWHIRQWRESAEKWFKDKEREVAERAITHSREIALRRLTSAIIKESGLGIEQAAILAHKMLCKNRNAAKFIFNVDIDDVPEASGDEYLINRLIS